MTRVRRRRTRQLTGSAWWDEHRAWYLSTAEPGERPAQWWRLESPRPDLADGRSDQVATYFADLYPAALERAQARLRYLRDARLLSADEIREIHRRAAALPEPGRWGWRSAILREES